MEAQAVSETLGHNSILIQLIVREDLIAFSSTKASNIIFVKLCP